MRTIYLQEKGPSDLPACVATIGFFDGVHRGHQFLLSHVVKTAQKEGRLSMVITFDKHPREVLHADYQPQLLTSLHEKLCLLERTGVDVAVILHFDAALAQLSALDFMRDLLHRRLHVVKLFICYDHRFGHNRAEGFADYVVYGKEMGMEVVQNPVFKLNGENISSTICRRHVAAGEMEIATACLGHPYIIEGKVVSGFQEGRKMGFPTANIQPDEPRILIPASGVYAVKVRIEGEETWRLGMMNIGTRPTFGGDSLTLEAHIFNFNGNLYGKSLQVAVLHRIRDEHKFRSVEELTQQLKQDQQKIIEIEETNERE